MATLLYDLGRKVTASREGIVIKRQFRCVPYSDVNFAFAQLLGGVRFVGNRLVRTLPARDPIFTWAFCTDIDVEGTGTYGRMDAGGNFDASPSAGGPFSPAFMISTPTGYSGGAIMNCTFKTLEQDQKTEQDAGGQSQDQQEIDLAEETWDFSNVQQTVPGKFFKWQNAAPGQAPLFNQNFAFAKTFPRIEYSLTRHLCVRKPTLTITKLMGCVNKSAFRIGLDIWPPETLRFDGAHASHKITNQGIKFYDIQYKFGICPTFDIITPAPGGPNPYFVGWNRQYDPARDAFDYICLSTNSNRLTYLYDEDVASLTYGSPPAAHKGFVLLFSPYSN